MLSQNKNSFFFFLRLLFQKLQETTCLHIYSLYIFLERILLYYCWNNLTFLPLIWPIVVSRYLYRTRYMLQFPILQFAVTCYGYRLFIIILQRNVQE